MFLAYIWFFASHYLKWATQISFDCKYNFFRTYGEQKLRRRKRILLAVDVVAYVFLIGTWLLQFVHGSELFYAWALMVPLIFTLWVVLLILYFSMRSIRKNLRVVDGIFVNKWLMRVFFVGLAGMTICDTVYASLLAVKRQYEETVPLIERAMISCDVLETTSHLMLHIAMLIYVIRFSQDVS